MSPALMASSGGGGLRVPCWGGARGPHTGSGETAGAIFVAANETPATARLQPAGHPGEVPPGVLITPGTITQMPTPELSSP